MGFCKRCGDIINTDKCAKCGGVSVSGVVKFNGLPGSPKKADRWEKKYTNRRSVSPPPRPTTLQQLDPNTVNNRYPTTPSPKKRFPRPTSVDIKGGYPRPTLLFKKEVSQVPPVTELPTNDAILEETGPVVPMDDGLTLAKVHGTVLSPPKPLHCAHCNAVFPHNATLYPLSESQTTAANVLESSEANPLTGPYACLACFTQHRSLGPCSTCHKPVLPLKTPGNGPWITVRSQVWHARCFSCRGCGVDLSKKPMVGIGGDPECEACFGRVLSGAGTPKKDVKEMAREKTRETMEEMRDVFGTPQRQAAEPVEKAAVHSTPSHKLKPTDTCAICTNPLLPPPGQTAPLITAEGKQYHSACFVCQFCDEPFVQDGKEGTAVFTFVGEKPAHPSCAPTVTHTLPSIEEDATPLPTVTASSKPPFTLPAPISPTKRTSTLVLPRPLSRSPSKSRPSSLFFPPPPTSASACLPRPASPLKSPTFGGNRLHCPACSKAVSPMERGTVPGPGGGRWHAGCLKCGAENRVDDVDAEMGDSGERDMVDPEALKGRGCGKKLDTGAKEAGGKVWCRRCWDDLPPTIRPASPTRAAPLSPMHTGLSNLARAPSARSAPVFPRPFGRRESILLAPQVTGTGLMVNRQLAGGGLSRQTTGNGNGLGISTMGGGSPVKDVEGLMRQMTGNSGGMGSPTRRPRSTMFGSPVKLGMLEDLMED